MKSFIDRFHSRLGDFWWYSLLMFIALRCGDVINAVIGLWLVPKYVPQEELGAVLPLTQFATTFGVPISVLVLVFTKYLAQFKAKGELGKVKSLLCWFLSFVMIAAVVSIALAKFTLPALFERIRIEDGSLSLLIIATGIVGTVAPVFNNALQGLKKFKTITVLNLVGAPIRLLSMLVLLPIRALSGYMAAQLIPSIVAIITSALSIRKDVNKSVVSVPFWKEDLKPILRYFWFCALWVVPGSIWCLLQSIVIRQRLPEIESAAFYVISRFAEIVTYAGTTLSFVMFPIATEMSTNGKNTFPLLFKMSIATLACGLLATLFLYIVGNSIFSFIPMYKDYEPFVPDLIILSVQMTLSVVGCNYASFESAHGRFSFLWFGIPIAFIKTLILVCFTGYQFFYGILPENIVSWMGSLHVATLRNVLWIILSATTLNVALYFVEALHRYKQERSE